MECRDVQAPPPPFSPGAPQFAPQSLEPRPRRSSRHCQLGEAGEPTDQMVFFRLGSGRLRACSAAFWRSWGPVGGPSS